jgi:hypothetical protein
MQPPHIVGRDFVDERKPLGYELLDRTLETHDLELLANRTKAVAVLRKAEEFLYTHNPGANEPGGVHRALELAAGRVGVEYPEYVKIVKRDPELQRIEREVIDDARARS